MIVIEKSDVLTLDVFIEQLHHVDHLFRRVFSGDHHVDAFEIGLALQVAAVTINGRHHDDWSYGRDSHNDCSHYAQWCISADRLHHVHGEEFFAAAAIMQISMSPHYVRELMGDDRREL